MTALLLGTLGPLLLVTASTAEAAPTKADDAKAINDERVTCKSIRQVGSRIPQKECKPNHVWAEERRAQIEAKRSSANRHSSCGESGPC